MNKLKTPFDLLIKLTICTCIFTSGATQRTRQPIRSNQRASGDGVRQLIDWYEAGIIGDVHTVYCWTDRPVWPQGIAWSNQKAEVPKELDWNL
jgi:hypothetical protein